MSRLPEPGDVRRATDMLDARVRAITNGGEFAASGPLRLDGDRLVGEADPIFSAYGDLFDPGEVLSEIGFLMIKATSADIILTRDSDSALATMLLHAMALGCLMERTRWSR